MSAAELPPIIKFEPVSPATIRQVSRGLGPIQSMILHLGEVDIGAGAGVIGPSQKCLWTKDGRRITFDLRGGTFIGDLSKNPDPAKPKNNGEA